MQSIHKKILILGAFEPEIFSLQNQHQKFRHRSSQNDPNQTQYEVGCCGIGMLDAALFLKEKILSEYIPDEVIFTGSAGAYKKTPSTPEFLVARSFSNYDLSIFHNQSATVANINQILSFSTGDVLEKISQKLGSNEDYLINSTNSISLVNLFTDHSLTKKYKTHNIFENLEGYGLAKVCHANKIPFGAILAITNEVGPAGSVQWQKNHKTMANQLQDSIGSILFADPL